MSYRCRLSNKFFLTRFNDFITRSGLDIARYLRYNFRTYNIIKIKFKIIDENVFQKPWPKSRCNKNYRYQM